MFTGSMGKIAVFCSYAREDEELRAALEACLAPLREERIVDDWYDHRIMPGQRWSDEIGSALDRARLVLFVVTPDLMASEYVADVEIPRVMEREVKGQCHVVPIMARPADWAGSPLAGFQALPRSGRWIEEHADRATAFAEIETGVREACKRIVDWENPYKRSQVGDWTHFEQTAVGDDGPSIVGEGTEELVAKSEREATVVVEVSMAGAFHEKTMTIDLSVPLEDRMGDMMRTAGIDLPANLEISIGPAQYDDEVLHIGGRRYETFRARRALTLTQRGQTWSGTTTTWRSIDVPLFGTVKGEGNLPGLRQHQVLLDYGQGDATTRKPRVRAEHAASASGSAGPRPLLVTPGRWLVEMNTFGVVSAFDLLLHPNGTLQGQQNVLGVGAELRGQWLFDPASNELGFRLVTIMMGIPVNEDNVQIQITSAHGQLLLAQDALGRQFQLRRVG